MADKTLDTLFHDTLKDIYYAERKILKSLPKMVRAAQSPDLKAAFEKHIGQTEGQIERLQQVFEIIGKPARGKTCEAIEGILTEGDEIAESIRARRRWTRDCWRLPRPSNTMRSRATAR